MMLMFLLGDRNTVCSWFEASFIVLFYVFEEVFEAMWLMAKEEESYPSSLKTI